MLAMAVCFDSVNAHAAEGNAVAPASNILKITADTPAAALTGKSDNDLVELPSGRKLRMGDLRQFSKKAAELKSAEARKKPMPQVFKMKPGAKGFAIKTGSDLSQALKRPDSETVELPSGRRATVGQIRLLQPYLEKRLGHKLAQTRGPGAKGEVLKVQASRDKTYWKTILQKPDSTVLEAPDGTRITVGDLKQTLATYNTARSASPRISK